ncbi:MAG: ABC transporter permease [Acidobacteriaceae bacterium]|nr:ABC transporter permease [Acidobacteriaceae bacterium]
MKFIREFYLRLWWLFSRSRFRSELADEIEFHVESRAEELEQGGVARLEALARARREFGSKLKAAEDSSGPWQMRWLENLFSDLRYAARAFRRSPGFAVTAIFCLALGIGAKAVIFNITTNFLFSQPSCRDASSLIAIWEGGNSALPVTDYKFLLDSHIFDGVAGLNVEREVNWRDGDRTSRFYAGLVTDDFFTALGIPFRMGRGIAPGEKNTAVLSYNAWHSKFAADPAILGRALMLEGRLYIVTGVLPANHRSIFGFGVSPDVYIPVTHDDDYVQLYARMPKGMTLPMATARVQSLFAQLDRIHPYEAWKRNSGTRVTHVTGFDLLNQMMPSVVTAFFAMLMIVAGLVLLIACANVGSLLLARASTRSHELAIRLSLGASRGRIVRHLLAESLLLAVIGSMAGLLIDAVCVNLIGKLDLPVPVPVHLVISPDWRLWWYSLALALTSALLCGLLPALKSLRKDVSDTMKQGERQTPRAWNIRSLLVAAQLAVSIILLATALLFVHNLLRVTSMDPGFDIHHTSWAYMRLVPDRYAGTNQTNQMALVHEALEQLRALPGVESAAITRRVPLNDNCVTGAPVTTDLSPTAIHVQYECNNVGPEYFHTIGIPILLGREFAATDRKGSQQVAIVNESFAHALFEKSNPVGHVITIKLQEQTSMLIVGVAKDSKYFTLGEKQRLAVYQPYFAFNEPVNLHFLIRTAGSPTSLTKEVAAVLGRLDPTAAIETKPMNQALALALLPSRIGAVMLGAMGILGLALAAIGLYGLLLYSVSRRTREIGLRVALGATPPAVLRLICRHSLALVGLGTLVGLALAAFAMQPLALFLVPGLSTFDPSAFLSVVGVLAVVALLATLAPGFRALRVDPITALRYE